MKRLENKNVFVTGGLSGIGRACAVAAAEEGANVVIADIKSVALDETMKELLSENPKSFFIDCDVTNPDQMAEAISSVLEKFGSIDVALNNAGIPGEGKRIDELASEEWNYVINVNLTGVFNCMKQELVAMVNQKSGVIVNMASVLGKVGFATSAAYVAAKHGVIGLTKTAALEYALDNIRVNAISPGFIETPMLTKEGLNSDEKSKQKIIGLHAMNRLGSAKEIANAFIFLASDESSFITGSCLDVDGGYLAQ